ncbi:MAG: dihydroxyacetone kinase, partial [Actinobacteria bacterium]|nr:dihydroxyacetone kinase [Actinomycetota bacterium]
MGSESVALAALDAPAARRWVAASLASVESHCEELNRLNVFPVSDADTGTNLVATLRPAAHAVAGSDDPTAAAVLRRAADEALR